MMDVLIASEMRMPAIVRYFAMISCRAGIHSARGMGSNMGAAKERFPAGSVDRARPGESGGYDAMVL